MSRLIDAGLHPLIGGAPPEWASAWGQDRFGVWVAFAIGDTAQRMRWIPPGRFMMGSPESERGRWRVEGPQREVTIAEGFWLADTPCIQALWQAVTGENPSGFKEPTRPVEKVSFTDVQAFLQRIEERLPGLNLVLPSEAWWEYACRAGAAAATYAGDFDPEADDGLAVLDPIAWWAANRGRERGPHPVAQKRANAWGLHDMLGNVWEWCVDHWRETLDATRSDGSASVDASARESAPRVVRGGSWLDGARRVRAACRDHAVPSDRHGNLGFRCARAQTSR